MLRYKNTFMHFFFLHELSHSLILFGHHLLLLLLFSVLGGGLRFVLLLPPEPSW